MRRVITIVLLFAAVTVSWSQECERNMLSTPNANGYGKVAKGSLQLSGGFTIEAWIKASTYVQNAAIIEYGKVADTGIFSIKVGAQSTINCSFSFTSGRETIDGPALPTPLDWNHIAVTFTPNDSLRLYVNGVQVASRKTTASRLRTISGDSLYFGFSPLTSTSYIGAIDEVRIWSAARSHATIAAARTLTYFGNEPNLAAYWRFDDDVQYPRFHDFTDRGLNGIAVGSALLVPSSSPVGGVNHPGYMIVAIEKAIDMGTIYCSSSKDTVLHIRNLGPEEVNIDVGFDLNGRGVFSFSKPAVLPLPPDPTATATIRIQADPTLNGRITDTLNITAKNVCGGIIRIPVEVTIIRTDIELRTKDSSRKALVFPKSKPFLPCQLPFTDEVRLWNVGERNVTVRSLKFLQQAGITLEGISLPFTLLPGQSRFLKLRFEQGEDGTFYDTLVVQSAECNLLDSIVVEFTRASIGYTLAEKQIVFDDARLLPSTTIVRDTDIYITNTGTADIYIPEFKISGKNYQFRGIQNSAYIYPGKTERLKVRFQSNECPGVYKGVIVFEAPTGCALKDSIFLQITVRGPEFEPVRSAYTFEPTCTVPKDTLVGIINRSGVPISVSSVQFLNNVFRFATAPLPAAPVPDGDTFYARVRFEPTAPGRHRDTIRFFTNPCGYIDIPLEGYWGVGEIALSDTSVEFGHQCNLAVETKTVTITNTTGKAFWITSKSFSGSSAITLVDTMPIQLQPGNSRTLSFRFAPTAFNKYETTFFFTFNGCYVVNLTARGVRERATIRWSAQDLDFGERCPNTLVDSTLRLHNDGFASHLITDAIIDDGHFSVSNLIGHNIAPGSWLDTPIMFLPDSVGPFAATLTLVFSPCNDTIRLPMRGVGGPAPTLVISDTIMDFNKVRLGKTATKCLTISNPSCLPIYLGVDEISITLPSEGMSLSAASQQMLPKNISHDSSLTLCFDFAPTTVDSASAIVIIKGANGFMRVYLRGIGVDPLIKADERSIDFGEVEVADTAIRTAVIRNYGNDTARISSYSVVRPEFSLETGLKTLIDRGDSELIDITFKPSQVGSVLDYLVIPWDNGTETIQLIGKGVPPGLTFPTSKGIDFGDVRLKKIAVDTIQITGSPNAEYPIIIDPIEMQGPDAGQFTYVLLPDNKTQLDSAADKMWVEITYAPDSENVDTADLVFYYQDRSSSLPLRGRGVEAHLIIEVDTVNFGSTVINDTAERTFTIRNDGDFPLKIDSTSQKFAQIFSELTTSVLNTPSPIPGRSEIKVKGVFKPTRAINYLDSLTIFADAAEPYDFVYLKGRGTATPQGDPDIVYRIDDAELRVGDVTDLAVHIGGADLDKLDVDTIYTQIKYDPTVAYVYDIVLTEGLQTEGMRTSIDRHYADSTVRIEFAGSPRQLREGILCMLRVEALLGPIDSTRFIVEDAVPRNTGNILLNSGLFHVTDCGEYRTNILLKGPYSISMPHPNPVSNTALLEYELGLDGPVTITLTDALGRSVKTILDEFARKGKHKIAFSVDDLASGSYILVIKSLEYRETNKFIVAD